MGRGSCGEREDALVAVQVIMVSCGQIKMIKMSCGYNNALAAASDGQKFRWVQLEDAQSTVQVNMMSCGEGKMNNFGH